MKNSPVYQLKISLKNSPQPVWRRVLVSSSDTFAQLHDHIMECFDDVCVIYDFVMAKGKTSGWIIIKGEDIPSEDYDFLENDDPREKLATETTLQDVFGKHYVKRLSHTYNFAHGVGHEVLLEKVLSAREISKLQNQNFPVVIKSKGEMTPEISNVLFHGDISDDEETFSAEALTQDETLVDSSWFDLGELGKVNGGLMMLIAKCLFIGSYIMEDDNNPRDKGIEAIEELESAVIGLLLAHKAISPETAEYSAKLQSFFWNIDMEEEIMSHINKHDESQFWHELITRLGWRDLTKKFGMSKIQKWKDNNRWRRIEEACAVYEKEFEENGTERLRIVE